MEPAGGFLVSLLVESAVLLPHGWAMAANPTNTVLAGAEMGARFDLRFYRSKPGSLLGSRMGWQRQRSAQAAQRGIVQLHPPTIQAGEIIHDRQAKP